MDLRCIALDLDRTTLDREGHLSPGNRAALEHAIAKGVHVVIASGRGFASLPREVTAVPGIEYAVTSNGAAVYHIPTGKRLFRRFLTPRSVEDILCLTEGFGGALEVFVDGTAYAGAAYVADPVRFGATAAAIPYVQATRTPVEDLTAFLRAHRDQLESLDLVVGPAEVRRRLWDALAALPDLYLTSSVPQLIEVSRAGGGKHTGVRYVAERLGLTPAQIAAFGDGDNDAELLSFSGCGIAVANASPACLAAADRVTARHDEDGVARGIYEILHL